MFHVEDQVIYGVHGVCQIIDLQIQKINGKKVEYYVLEPIRQPGARFFVPSQSDIAAAKLRPVLTKEEVDLLFAMLNLQRISGRMMRICASSYTAN